MPIRSGQSKRQNIQIGEGKKLRKKKESKIKMNAARVKQFSRFFLLNSFAFSSNFLKTRVLSFACLFKFYIFFFRLQHKRQALLVAFRHYFYKLFSTFPIRYWFYAFIYKYLSTHTHIHIHIYVCLCIRTGYKYTHTHTHSHIHTCYVCIYVYVYVYIHSHTHREKYVGLMIWCIA